MGLLLWGRTEGNPGIIPLFSFGYGVDRLLEGISLIKIISFLYYSSGPGGHSNNSSPAPSPERCVSYTHTF